MEQIKITVNGIEMTGNKGDTILKLRNVIFDDFIRIADYGYVVKIGNKFNNVFRHYPELKQWLKENTIGKSLIDYLNLLIY